MARTTFTVTCEERLHRLLKKAAQDESRTLPQQTMHILRTHFGITAGKAIGRGRRHEE